MNRFTISPDFLEYAATEESGDMLCNVLFVFAQDNRFKLCMDKGGRASVEYNSIIYNYREKLELWIKLLNIRPNCIETVTLTEDHFETHQDLFLAIASKINPYKRLVTSDKSFFNSWQDLVDCNGINLIDGVETKEMLRSTIVLQMSLGNISPIINGNNNKIIIGNNKTID